MYEVLTIPHYLQSSATKEHSHSNNIIQTKIGKICVQLLGLVRVYVYQGPSYSYVYVYIFLVAQL